MSLPKRRRLLVILAGAAAVLALYFGAYFACVSIRYQHGLAFKEKSMQEAYAHYKVVPALEGAAQWLFTPARLFDALYLRPHSWEDRRQPAAS